VIVADVHHKAAGNRRRVDPLAVAVAHLQAAGVVLIEQGDAAVIGVRPGTLLFGTAGGVARRVVDHAQHADRFMEACVEEVALDPQCQGHGAQQGLRQRLHIGVVLLHQRSPAGHIRMAVGPAQWLAGQYLGVIGGHVETHVEGFLEVAGFARVQLLGGDGPVAAVMGGLGDIDLELFLRRQGEEGLGRAQQFGDARRADRMASDIEETPVAAGAVDLLGHGGPGGLVVAVERGDIDNW
jgi:hypothetical protein